MFREGYGQTKYDQQEPEWEEVPEFTGQHTEDFIIDLANAEDPEQFWKTDIYLEDCGLARLMQQIAKEYLKGVVQIEFYRWAKDQAMERFDCELKGLR